MQYRCTRDIECLNLVWSDLVPSAEHHILPLLSREPLPRTPYVCLRVGRLSVYRVKALEQLGSTLIGSFHFTDKLCCRQ